MSDFNKGKPREEWKLPTGYKGAYEKARDEWNKTNGRPVPPPKPSGKVNAFQIPTIGDSEDESDTEYGLSRIGTPLLCAAFKAIRGGTPMSKAQCPCAHNDVTTSNKFDKLADPHMCREHDRAIDDAVNHLNSWAHTVKI